jgi:hypothetical protein
MAEGFPGAAKQGHTNLPHGETQTARTVGVLTAAV